MEQAITLIGLPVKCGYGDCGRIGLVRPQTDYGGWYKSKLHRFHHKKKWWCPEHYDFAKQRDEHFYKFRDNYPTPLPEPVVETVESTTEELYDLID